MDAHPSSPPADLANQHGLRDFAAFVLRHYPNHAWQLVGPGVLALSLAADTHLCAWGELNHHDTDWILDLPAGHYLKCMVIAGHLYWHRHYPLSGLSDAPHPRATRQYRVGQLKPDGMIEALSSTVTRYNHRIEFQGPGQTFIADDSVCAGFESVPGTVALIHLVGAPRLLWPADVEIPTKFMRPASLDEATRITRLGLAAIGALEVVAAPRVETHHPQPPSHDDAPAGEAGEDSLGTHLVHSPVQAPAPASSSPRPLPLIAATHREPMNATADELYELRRPLREQFPQAGISITEWAQSNGFSRAAVYAVLNGRMTGHRGQGHSIAVALGLKNPTSSMDLPPRPDSGQLPPRAR